MVSALASQPHIIFLARTALRPPTQVCKGSISQGYQYCQPCSYHKGMCAMCGIPILDTKGYKQSAT